MRAVPVLETLPETKYAPGAVTRPFIVTSPLNVAFTAVIAPMKEEAPVKVDAALTVRVLSDEIPEDVIVASVVSPDIVTAASVESPVIAIVELNVAEPETRVPVVIEVAPREVAVAAAIFDVEPFATTKLLTTVVVVSVMVKRGLRSGTFRTEKEFAVSEPVAIEVLTKHGVALVIKDPKVTPPGVWIESEVILVRMIGLIAVP